MLKKMIILSLVMIFIFPGISYAAENPFNGLTKDQVVQKYFEGRQIEPIEGVWLNDELKPVIIIKANLIASSNSDSYDYLMVEYSSSEKTDISGVRKTQYPSAFELGKYKWPLRFVNPTALMGSFKGLYNFHLLYTRIYPTEVK